MSKKINYNARVYEDYKNELKKLTEKYYPSIINDFNDASIGMWMVDLNAAIGDNLSYHMDRMYQETQLDYAQERNSLLTIARTNNLNVGGKKPSIVEARWSCVLPSIGDKPDWTKAPIIRRGTKASGGGQNFELREDLDFSKQFNNEAISDRSYIPIDDGDGNLFYRVSKTCIMSSTETRIYKQYIDTSSSKPFMEIILPENDVVKIESILVKEGYNTNNPNDNIFFSGDDIEYKRWYEVNNLMDNKHFTTNDVYSVDEVDDGENVSYSFIPPVAQWETLNRKFITEFTDRGYCKIIFGGGTLNSNVDYSGHIGKEMIYNALNKNYLGDYIDGDSTVFIMYSVGGGMRSNIGTGAMTDISYLNVDFNDSGDNIEIKNSIEVTNTIPSISGRDEFTNEEIRYLIKYNNSSQNRCVTLGDYVSRVMLMPSEYGSPFKVNATNENNKITLSMLALNGNGQLENNVAGNLLDNIIEYISEYKMLGDYVYVKPGKIINLSFEVEVVVSNASKKEEIAKEIILLIKDYMDINKNEMGKEIYLNKLKSTIGVMGGVNNLININVYNEYGDGYSTDRISQRVVEIDSEIDRTLVDLEYSDNLLLPTNDSMFEIKYPNKDIKVITKYEVRNKTV